MDPSALSMAIVVVLSFSGVTFAAPAVGIAAQSPDEQNAPDAPPAPSSQPASRNPTTQRNPGSRLHQRNDPPRLGGPQLGPVASGIGL